MENVELLTQLAKKMELFVQEMMNAVNQPVVETFYVFFC